MKAIILAAGEGSRLRPLTYTKPKPLVDIFGKSILEHNMESLYKYIDEFIIVIKYKKEKIIEKLGNKFQGVKITYHEQNPDSPGTGGAIRGIKRQKGDIIIMNGDSIFDRQDIEMLCKLKGYGALVQEVENTKNFGIYKQDKKGNAVSIVEKPQDYIGNLANLGVYKFNEKIFSIVETIKLSKRGEYEITDAINNFLSEYPFKLLPIKGDFIDVGYPWHVIQANKYFLDKLNYNEIKGEIEEGVKIKGHIILGKGSIIKSGTYIEGNAMIGENCIIGPQSYIKGNVIIGDGSEISFNSKIQDSAIGNNVIVGIFSYIGFSVIGNNVIIEEGFITNTTHHTLKNINVLIKGEYIDTGVKNFGCMIGDDAKISPRTTMLCGSLLDNNRITMAGDIIR